MGGDGHGRSRKRRPSPPPSPSPSPDGGAAGAASEEEGERRRGRGKSRSHKADDGERASRGEGKKSLREEEKDEKSRKGGEKSRKMSHEDKEEKKGRKKKKSREKEKHMSSDGKASDSMALGIGSYGSGGGSRLQRHRTTSQQPVLRLPAPRGSTTSSPSSSAVGPSTQAWGRGYGRRGPTRGVTYRRLEEGQRWNVRVIGGTGVGKSGAKFVSHMGIVSKMHCKIWQKDFASLPTEKIATLFRDLELNFQWDRTSDTDKEMLMHMSSMHRSWRGVLKKRHYTGKSLEDAIASVPAGVDPSDWQTMCEKWNTSDEQSIADRNKTNRSHQSMQYRRGRTSHYQLKDDFRHVHECDPDRLEVFKMGRCKQLPDGSEHWVDDESRSRYEKMTLLMNPSLDSESGSTPISPEQAFISVMGKDRSGRVRCGGSRETLRTWYGPGEGPSSFIYKQQIQTMEDKVKAQGEVMEQLRTQVEEMRTQQSQVEDLRRQVAEMEEMRRHIEEMRSQQSEMDEMRRQVARVNTFMIQFQASRGGAQPQGAVVRDDGDTDEEGDDYDDD